MSSNDNLDIAAQAERDLNSYASKTSNRDQSDSARESGVDDSVTTKFPGSEVTYGDDFKSGAGDNRAIPTTEGGDLDATGKPFKASAYEDEGGPQEEAEQYEQDFGGDDDVRGNIRQGGETRRPPGPAK